MDNWELYFMNIVGWKLHPGNKRDPNYKIDLKECSDLATQMLKEQKRCRG